MDQLTAKAFLRAHCARYPALQVQDTFKAIYQSSFGCEHLLADPSAAAEGIRAEQAACGPRPGPVAEPLAGDFCRVHLGSLPEGLRPESLARMMVLSAQEAPDGAAQRDTMLAALRQLTEEGALPFSLWELGAAEETWRLSGYAPLHHSPAFRAAYAPAYRVVRQDLARFLPLYARIDQLLDTGKPVILAIDGGSATGKTTLGELLRQLYGCQVFHMDDFFLRPEQRTPERFAQPGGNVDRERFLEEVLEPLRRGETIQYRRFDCQTFTLQPARTLEPAQLNVVEGAYSMHPELAGYYDASVFLHLPAQAQRERILRRNTPQQAEMFFTRWIPFEQRYFEGMDVENRCDLRFDTSAPL